MSASLTWSTGGRGGPGGGGARGPGRFLRGPGALLACGLLLTACTSAGGGGSRPPGSAKDAAVTPSAVASSGATSSAGADAVRSDSLPEEADPARTPKSVFAATALVRKVIADPELVGAGAVRATPYESDARTWAVLRDGCVWQREKLPGDVLATLTRYFDAPGGKGEAPMRLSATVTVHRATLDAAWEQSGMLEEAMGCPTQELGGDERLTGLQSSAFAYGEGSNLYADDVLKERGECRGGKRGGASPYRWTQATFGPVVVSASVCGGRAGGAEQGDPMTDYFIRMLRRAKDAIGRPTDGSSAQPSGQASGRPSGRASDSASGTSASGAPAVPGASSRAGEGGA